MIKLDTTFTRLIYVGVGIFLAIVFIELGLSATCWQYTSSNNASCTAANGCIWRADAWGGWCSELNCWSLNTQNACATTSVPGKNCTWQPGTTNYFCEDINCWSFSGTNQNACESNIANKSCTWANNCYSTGTMAGCSAYTTQATCTNATGCAWGLCQEKGCYDYTTSATCGAARDWNGRNCTWSSSDSKCNYNSCWSTKLYPNETACNAAQGVKCQWKWNACQDVGCWTYDFTNETACVNNTAGLGCTWTSGSYCSTAGCWAENTNATCSAKPGCQWKGWTSSGWCNEVQCSNFGSIGGSNVSLNTTGNRSLCESNTYGLGCKWNGDPPGNLTSGWCYQEVSSKACANFTTERNCVDTHYCWWTFTNTADQAAGGTCSEPSWGTGAYQNISSISNDWNPGCYLFDLNSTKCNNVLGCNYTGGICNKVSAGTFSEYGTNITKDGIKCSYINDSALCNNIAALSNCCAWQNSSCVNNRYTTSCFDQLKQTPNGEEACEDAETKGDCDTIAADPWYMPCTWNNVSDRCSFKATSVFGNTTQSLIKLENERNCEAAGGKWITENYCVGNISVPTGRCEYKFNDEDDCDKACFACELKDGNGNKVNATNARSACVDSLLGFCEFTVNTRAPNGIGYCKAKETWRTGTAGDCNTNCGDCTYKGDPSNNDTTRRPSYYCTQSDANKDGGGCKWISDNSTTQGGYCAKKGEKTCEDACDRCKAQSECASLGRKAIANQTGSCKWQGTTNDGSCVANTGEEVEICWNGGDDDDDGLIDCSDPGCYVDSYCGLVSGDCFGWKNNNTCLSNSCEWVVDKWGSWCDFKGGQCWKYDRNESECAGQTNCVWNNGTGSGWCERDWDIAETCMGNNRTLCNADTNCVFTNDTWCDGFGKGGDWCNTMGGWCDHKDFAPKNCWQKSNNATCSTTTGCNWKVDQWSKQHCEVNWSANCWQYVNSTNCATSSLCMWRNETYGAYNSAWCDSIMGECWSVSTQSACSAKGTKCSWRNESWGGYCQPACFNTTLDSSASECGAVSSCVWKAENGWCEESAMTACANSTSTNNQTLCDATSGCQWNNPGWCNPKGGFTCGSTSGGGGVSASAGGDCYKYDGNETLCTNKTIINTSCGWIVNSQPTCQIDWSKDCWKYTSVVGGCNSTNGCWFKNDSIGSYCTNVMDQCWLNTTLIANATACNQNAYCNSTLYGCESTCYSAPSQTQSACVGVAGCRWNSGWCNPSSVSQLFDTMEAGAPVPLGGDPCGPLGGVNEPAQQSVDICGFGMKDMGDAYGFGANMYDFGNASVCNKEKISSFVVGLVGGAFNTSAATEKVGAGNDTVILLVYLDTDGKSTGGCELSHNSSAEGYEFRFKYASIWNVSTNKPLETFNAYKCDNSKWTATDVKLSTWKKSMCSEIGGPLIAVEKADLARFPTLYDATKDMRVSIATIGHISGNVTDPSDRAGPSWVTPGSVDFEITDVFSYNADAAKFEDILRQGFVKYEDCFNSLDDDSDESIDCNDWDCQYASVCSGKGVNSTGFNDTTTARVVGVKIEEYPDAALLMYDTDKPTNGTLEFYKNDSRCLKLNDTIHDMGITSANVRDYKLWHIAEIYNGSVTNNLEYPLINDTTYYYKLRVCDASNKCALSKCSSFTTSSTAKCGYCNFVARLKVSTGWNVSYDFERDGTYETAQGEQCGVTAGVKGNYTTGRRVNIKMEKTDKTIYFEFLNASLTKTGLNDKVRSISDSGAVIGTSTLVGLSSETRDKIINSLHPEACRIKIPFSETCNALFHCDDSGANCVDRTSSATLIDAVNCVWQIPDCEFSTYRESTSSGSSGGSSSSGGGGGSGGVSKKKTANATQTGEGYTAPGETQQQETSGGTAEGDRGVPQFLPEEREGKSSVFFWAVITLILVAVGVAIVYIKRSSRVRKFR